MLSDDGYPVGGLVVLVGEQVSATDIEGKFEVLDVTPPYDLYIAGRDDDEEAFGYVFIGVTRPDPVVYLTWQDLDDLDVEPDVDVDWKVAAQPVSIALPGNPANVTGSATFEGLLEPQKFSTGTSMQGVPLTFTAQPRWPGDSTAKEVTFHALLASDQTTYHATGPLVLHEGTNPTLSVTATITTMGHLTGTISGLPDSAGLRVVGNYRFGIQLLERFSAFDRTGPDFTAFVSDVPGATFDVSVSTDLGEGRTTYTAMGLTLADGFPTTDFVEPPDLIDPLDDAVQVDRSAVFRYKPQAGAVHAVHFWGDDQHFVVVTMADRVSFPDVTRLGIAPPPPDEDIEWYVEAYPSATIDAALTIDGFDRPFARPPSTTPIIIGESGDREFAFASSPARR